MHDPTLKYVKTLRTLLLGGVARDRALALLRDTFKLTPAQVHELDRRAKANE